jgi:hypothetical protein
MSTRGQLFISGPAFMRGTETLELFKSTDAYPTNTLGTIARALKASQRQHAEQAALFKEPKPGEVRAAQFVGLLIGEETTCYGMSVHLQDTDWGVPFHASMVKEDDAWIEWTYVIDLDKKVVNVYRSFAGGLVDPCEYASQLYPEYQKRTRTAITKHVSAIEALGFKVNPKSPARRKPKAVGGAK